MNEHTYFDRILDACEEAEEKLLRAEYMAFLGDAIVELESRLAVAKAKKETT